MKKPIQQTLLYLVLSIFIVFFSKQIYALIVYIDLFYTIINLKLAPIFSNSPLGIMIRNVISLALLPLIIIGIPALIYRGLKGSQLPYFMEIMWFLWLILALSKVLVR